MTGVQQWLAEARVGKLTAAELFPRLPQAMPQIVVACHSDEPAGSLKLSLFLELGGAKAPVLFTDPDTARAFAKDSPCQQTDGCAALRNIIRAGYTAAILNPGLDQLVLDRRHLLLLFREYALAELLRMGGAWVPTLDGSLLVVQIKPGVCTVPVFLSEVDAQPTCSQHEGTAAFHPWPQIRSRCQEASAEGPLLQYGLPEQIGLLRRHLADLCGDSRPDPLDKLEKVIAESRGIANALEVCQALANLESIWTLRDEEGSMVGVGSYLNLFTSAGHAEAFIAEARRKTPDLAPMFPRLMPARPLFQFLAAQKPSVAINQGSGPSWIGPGDTLPRVAAMMRTTAAQEAAPAQAAGTARKSWWQRLFSRK